MSLCCIRDEISSKLHRCDAKDCENRYWSRRSQIRGLNFWTEEEDALLRSLMEKFEGSKPNWRLISSYLPTRTTAAIKTHWRDIRKKDRERNLTEESIPDSEKSTHRPPTPPYTGGEVFRSIFPSASLSALSSDSIRCNSEDSQVTYVPDADPRFCQWSSVTLDEDTSSSSVYLHRVDSTGEPEDRETHSNFGGSLPFPMYNTDGRALKEASEPIESPSQEMGVTESQYSSAESVSHSAEEDFVSSFIETFGDVDDEATMLGPLPESNLPLPSTKAPEQSKPVPKRTLTSWEAAKSSFPQRKRSEARSPRVEAVEIAKPVIDSPSRKKRKLVPSADRVVQPQKRYTKARELQEARDSSMRYGPPSLYENFEDLYFGDAIYNGVVPFSSDAIQHAYLSTVSGGAMSVSELQEQGLVGDIAGAFQPQNMLVYVPCIYTNNPRAASQPAQFATVDHSTLLGLRQNPSKLRFVQAPSIVATQMRVSMVDERESH